MVFSQQANKKSNIINKKGIDMFIVNSFFYDKKREAYLHASL